MSRFIFGIIYYVSLYDMQSVNEILNVWSNSLAIDDLMVKNLGTYYKISFIRVWKFWILLEIVVNVCAWMSIIEWL